MSDILPRNKIAFGEQVGPPDRPKIGLPVTLALDHELLRREKLYELVEQLMGCRYWRWHPQWTCCNVDLPLPPGKTREQRVSAEDQKGNRGTLMKTITLHPLVIVVEGFYVGTRRRSLVI